MVTIQQLRALALGASDVESIEAMIIEAASNGQMSCNIECRDQAHAFQTKKYLESMKLTVMWIDEEDAGCEHALHISWD